MMASSSSSSDLSADHHLLQDDLPWPSSLPLAPALHHTIGGNHQWSHPLMLDHLSSDELDALLSTQGHHHNRSQLPAAPTSHQLSSLLMMQELGFQWSSCAVAETETPMLITSQQDSVKEEEELPDSLHNNLRSSSIAYNDIVDGAGLPELDGAVVLPSVNVSRLQKPCPAAAAAAAPLAGGNAFEMLASARLCKSLLISQAASSVLAHNGGMPLLREHVPYGPPAHRLQGPSIHSYKMGVPAALVNGNGNVRGRGGHGSNASCHDQQQAVAISKKKPRLESLSSTTIVPSFKVRKEKLGDRIAALQQLVSPFGKTDTASVLMEAIGYIKFLQDQVETLSGPYMRSSKHKKARTTQQRGSSNAGEKDEAKLDLRSRGLCLVPLSCTSYVTNENGVWAPLNFRGN